MSTALVCRRMPGLPGDAPLRTDENGRPVNRAFLDMPQGQPEVHAEPGFEDEVHAHNLFGYLSRSDVTWDPSVSSVVKQSLFCPTTEEYMLPVKHGNDRMEWFVQLSDRFSASASGRGQPSGASMAINTDCILDCIPFIHLTTVCHGSCLPARTFSKFKSLS